MPKNSTISAAVITREDGLCLFSLSGQIALLTDSNLNPLFSIDLSRENFHELRLQVNHSARHTLALYTNYLDDSGRSYYGTNRLQLIDTYTGQGKEVLTIKGPVHSSRWNPNGQEFIALSGAMPAHAIIYSDFGEPRIQFGVLYANFAKWSPNGQFIAVGGFGSLDTGLSILETASSANSAVLRRSRRLSSAG